MEFKSDSAVASLQQSLVMYRKLLSLIKTPKSEEELIRFIVDAIYEQYPDFRASFSNVGKDGQVFVHYSRQSETMISLTGHTLDMSPAPEFLSSLLNGECLPIPDIRKDSRFAPVVAKIIASIGSVAQLHIPFEEEEGKVSMISLVHSEATDWKEGTIFLMRELGELVNLMVREARTQAKLKKSENIFRQFADNVEIVFWLADLENGEISYISPAYERIWGLSTQSLYDNPRSFLEAIHPDDRPRVHTALLNQRELRYEETYRVIRPDGTVRWIKDRGFQIRDESGRVHRIAGFAEDITPLHEAQERLESTQAQVVSNAKFAALGEMASGIAHEINNPLAVIHGISVQLQEVLGDELETKPMVVDSLASVEKMANRIANIVKGLRNFSRQTDGDPMSAADLRTIVQETIALCEAKVRAAGIDIRVNIPDSKLGISCRSSEISQVIVNLINNAYDAVAADKQSPRWISVRAELFDHGRARLQVEDSGTGIAAELRDRIFQPFFTTKEVGRGTGLGLSISKGIVEAHGGRLFLDTDVQNTRFVVEFPSDGI